MSNSITIEHAYFKKKQGIHAHEFCHRDEKIALENSEKKVRLAYMIISDTQSKTLNGKEKNKQNILNTVAKHYLPYLEEAIKLEAKPNGKNILYDHLRSSFEIPIKEKLVFLSQKALFCGHSYGSILKACDYDHAFEHVLEEKFKPKSQTQSIATLEYDKQSAQRLLKIEKEQTNEYLKENEQAYIMLSLPYVYNTIKGSQNQELEVEYDSSKLTASFMPELIVEYGVFFDGTNNNMYNIDFYQNFTKFLEEPAKYIEKNKGKIAPTDKQNTIQEFILLEPNPQFNDTASRMIINQINQAHPPIRYFDDESNLNISDQDILKSTKANHAKKVFEYLLGVKHGTKNSQEDTRAEYIREHILISKDENSSYTNGKSNISRLYELYDADDVKNNKDALPTTRFKLYESGSGTHNPFVNKTYKGDNVWGLGLATGETGIKAHIVYSCIKIAQQLRSANISHIDELVFDVFGFSRGAATARHFVNSILNNAQLLESNNKRKYTVQMNDEKDLFHPFFGDDGYVNIGGKYFFNPLRTDIKELKLNDYRTEKNEFYQASNITIDSLSFRFVGIYDTVPHIGLSQGDDWKDLNLDFFANNNDKKVGQVAHLMAEDEYRDNFRAYSIFQEINKDFRKTQGKFEEIYLPGAHSDVGGGYNAENETILLSAFAFKNTTGNLNKIKNKIINWNKKYQWIQEPITISEAKNKEAIEDQELDGFYYTLRRHYNPHDNIKNGYIEIYMHKTHVSNLYEHLSLKLMYNRAVFVDGNDEKNENDKAIQDPFERVPFGKPTQFSYNDKILIDAYKILSQNLYLKKNDNDLYANLKDSYLHHSSKASFVNKPSRKEKEDDDFYGKRLIYTSNGTQYTR